MEPSNPLILESQPSSRPPTSRLDDLAYVLPMGVFLAFTALGGHDASLYPFSYVAKTILTALVLILMRRRYTPISWKYSWLGILVGIMGLVQWVGMEKLIGAYYPKMSHDIFDPTQVFSSPANRWAFIAVRWAGASLLVPVMEEFFWRDYLWRTLLAPNDFKLAEVGEWDLKTFLIVAIIFGAGVHVEWLTAIVYGLLIGVLLVKTRSLGACIIAHGVTNFLLGGGDWIL